MAKRERVQKPLTVKLSSVADTDARKRIEELFDVFNEKRTASTKALRAAAMADARAGIAAQEVRMAYVEAISELGNHNEAVNREQVWTMFRDKEGEITFECPFTEVDQRNAMRVQRANVAQAAKSLGTSTESLYEGEEEESEDKPIGFGAH